MKKINKKKSKRKISHWYAQKCRLMKQYNKHLKICLLLWDIIYRIWWISNMAIYLHRKLGNYILNNLNIKM